MTPPSGEFAPAAGKSTASAGKKLVTKHHYLRVTALSVLLSACGDGGGGSSTGSNNLTTPTVNQAPTVNAGNDRSVIAHADVTLTGVASDSDGTVNSYKWVQTSGSNVTLSSTSTPTTSFKAPFAQSTETLEFQLTVTDNDDRSSTDRISVAVIPGSFTLSGTITAAPRSFIDSDVNDSFTNPVSNNASSNAQPLPNVATVGGFLSITGTGNQGDNFESDFDEYDSYAVRLEAGQRIVLTVSDFDSENPGAIDLDLALYRQSDVNNAIGSSLTSTAVETIDVTETGDYYILAYAYEGYSNYTLSLGWSDLPTSASSSPQDQPLSAELNFVPNEIIGPIPSNNTTSGSQKSLAPSTSTHFKISTNNNTFTVASQTHQKKNNDIHRLKVTEILSAQPITKNIQASSIDHNKEWGWGDKTEKVKTIQALKKLQNTNPQQTFDLNYIRQPAAIPNDTYYELQWHYPKINLPQAWEFSTGNNVTIAVIDTGIFLSHPELAANLTSDGYDFISSPTTSNDGDGIDNNPNDPGDEDAIASSSFHGTHVAGTIAAVSNNNSGVSGIAWNARILPIRVLGKNGGTDYDLIQGMRYAAGLSNDSGTIPDTPADILNLSLAAPGSSQSLQNTINDIIAEGIIIVAAAGNENTSTLSYPASNNGVVSVSASTIDDTLASYSNYGSEIDIAAPGGDSADSNNDGYQDGVLSTSVEEEESTPTPSLRFQMGTSMATPHVAGVAALMKSVYPTLTPQQFDNAIASGAITQDILNDGENVRNAQFGYGRIDALKAIEHATLLNSGTSLPAVLSAQPSLINFGNNLSSTPLTLSNVGGSQLSIDSITSNKSWLQVNANSIDSNGLGLYDIAANRTDLQEGSHLAEISVAGSNGDTLSIAVSLTILPASDIDADTGRQWLLLINPDNDEALDGDTVAAEEGIYRYEFNNIPPGEYLIASGSDSDNDFVICDPGESCGSYPVLGEPGIITVTNSSINNLNFISSFASNFSIQMNSVQIDNPRTNQTPGFSIPLKNSTGSASQQSGIYRLPLIKQREK